MLSIYLPVVTSSRSPHSVSISLILAMGASKRRVAATDEILCGNKKRVNLEDQIDKIKNNYGLSPEVEKQDHNEKDVSPSVPISKPSGLFLDTINRNRLEFDFEKVCSVSLSNLNVYACLVCGKYYKGRGKNSHAYIHSLHENHHVFINLHNLKAYILPDNYEINDPSLNDIKVYDLCICHTSDSSLEIIQHVINPIFTKEAIASLDKYSVEAYDLNNKRYLPGFVGLNNIKANDYMNVVVQALVHIPPIRHYFLSDTSYSGSELGKYALVPDLRSHQTKIASIVKRFGALTRKIWNDKAFKGQVSPHELVQEIYNSSKKMFRLTEKSDPINLMAWLLTELNSSMSKQVPPVDLIYKTFRGSLEIESQVFNNDGVSQKNGTREFDDLKEISAIRSPFLFLSLDLPAPPLFREDVENSIIPQISLSTLLAKYDGIHIQEHEYTLKRYRIVHLPDYLIFHIKRFTKNNWGPEKNLTIVNFPIKNLDMKPCVHESYLEDDKSYKYNLIANICHEGKPEPNNSFYKIHVNNKATDKWFQIQDLIVEEIMPQMIILSESYIQIWERKS